MSEVTDISQARVILASQSPRRCEYMERLGVDFYVMPADTPEPLPQHISPEDNAQQLALEKARAVAERVKQDYPEVTALVLASDTIAATAAGEQLAKAESETQAREMLAKLRSDVALSVTGVAIIDLATGQEATDVAVTEVHFRPLDEPGVADALETYIASEDWRDKAGAYGIQSGGAPLISGIRGEYSTITGLPINETRQLLSRKGIETREIVDQIPEGIDHYAR